MSRGRNESITTALVVVVAFCAAGFTIASIQLGPGFAIPVGIVGCVAAAIVLRGPLGHALARRLEGRTEVGNETVLQSVDEMRSEIAELAERVDFAERMLAQQREPDRLQR